MKFDKTSFVSIATGDPKIVNEIILCVNKTYKTNFKFQKCEDRSGVEFALVDKGAATLDEVFLLGFY
jgi:hypothetical protein